MIFTLQRNAMNKFILPTLIIVFFIITCMIPVKADSGKQVNEQLNSNLATAVKDLDLQQVKKILGDKASVSKKEIQHYLDELKNKVKKPFADAPWYQRYGTLTKIGIGLVGTALSVRFWRNAIAQNPEPGVGFSDLYVRFFKGQPSGHRLGVINGVHAPLCIASGIVGVMSVSAVINGLNELTEARNSLKRMALRAFLKQAIKVV